MLSSIPLVCGEEVGTNRQGERGARPAGQTLTGATTRLDHGGPCHVSGGSRSGTHCGTRRLEGRHAVSQRNEISQQSRCGGLDVPPLAEGGHGRTVDDGNDHLRLERAVELAQHTTQCSVEALSSLAVGVLDRGRLAGRDELEIVPEVGTMGGEGRLEDEPDPLRDIWNALEGLHSVGDMLRPGGPQPDIDQPR